MENGLIGSKEEEKENGVREALRRNTLTRQATIAEFRKIATLT